MVHVMGEKALHVCFKAGQPKRSHWCWGNKGPRKRGAAFVLWWSSVKTQLCVNHYCKPGEGVCVCVCTVVVFVFLVFKYFSTCQYLWEWKKGGWCRRLKSTKQTVVKMWESTIAYWLSSWFKFWCNIFVPRFAEIYWPLFICKKQNLKPISKKQKQKSLYLSVNWSYFVLIYFKIKMLNYFIISLQCNFIISYNYFIIWMLYKID